jgi:phosphonate utilization transcriptional regulator
MTLPITTIEMIQSHSLTTLVQREIEQRILSGEIGPGHKLNEADIASELSVSRSPVREAFRALEQVGLLRMEKNRGVFVRELSLTDADELYEIRASLDELIGHLAAERITAEQVEELRRLLKAMQKAARARSVNEYYPLNLQFHDLIAQFANNRALLGIYRRLVNELHLYRRETLAHAPDSFPISTREHAGIVDLLAKGDSEGAARLLYSHAMDSRKRLHATLDGSAARVQRRRARGTKTKVS